LTHSHLSRPPPDPASIVGQLANALDETGSFSSTQESLKFVRDVALDGIESIIRLSLRLETAFMVEVTSSDMSLMFAAPGAAFDDTIMANEYGSDGIAAPEKRDEWGRRYRIAGTTEVGIRKSICEGPGKGRRTVILLKTNVVLNMDVGGTGK